VDIGCANGGLINALRNLGYTRACGIDPSPSCVRYIRDSLHAEAWVGFVDQVPVGLGPFDGVVFSHVLEHLPHPSAALAMARQHVAPGGLVYVEVPDSSRYKDYLTAPFQEFNTEHINHFSEITLETLLVREGFAIVESGEKELESAPGMPYPAIYAICIKEESLNGKVRKDEVVEGHMDAYIQASTRIIEAMDQTIREALNTSPRLIVWGTGQLAMKLLAETVLGHADIVSFIDGNPVNQGRRIRGISVLSPEALDDRTTPILISSTIHEEEIGLAIRKRWNLPNPVIRLGNCLKA
jgi:SAM-dependent methyltransferase